MCLPVKMNIDYTIKSNNFEKQDNLKKNELMKNISLFFIFNIIFLFSCSVVNKEDKLTEQQVKNYISTYKNLKEKAPDILQQINQNPENSDIGKEKYSEIESIITEGGFRSYSEFVVVNTKIGAIFSILQANSSMQNFDEMTQSGNQSLESSIAEFERLIADQNTLEENKIEYRKAIEELKSAQNKINNDYTENNKWADLVMNGANKITGLIVSEEDALLVKNYESQIYEAYSGFPKPEIQNNTFPEIKFDY